eukprot:2466774-Amphidinium_carterae.1
MKQMPRPRVLHCVLAQCALYMGLLVAVAALLWPAALLWQMLLTVSSVLLIDEERPRMQGEKAA